MSRQETLFKCECGEHDKIRFKKPSYFTPSMLTHICSVCESEFTLKIFKPKGGEPGKIGILKKDMVLTDMYLDIVAKKEKQAEESRVSER